MGSLSASMLFGIFLKGTHSDFTITCKDREFNVHKVIISAESHFFQAICKGNFKEQNSVDLKEEDPEVVARVLHYLYLGDYHVDSKDCTAEAHSGPGRSSPQRSRNLNTRLDIRDPTFPYPSNDSDQDVIKSLRIHAETYRCADKLGILSLKTLTTDLFVGALKSSMHEPFFTEAIKLVYELGISDGCELRNAVTSLCLFNYQSISHHPTASAVLMEHEPVAWAAAQIVAKAQTESLEMAVKDAFVEASEYGSICPMCGNSFREDDVEVRSDGKYHMMVRAKCRDKKCDGEVEIEVTC